MMKHSNRSRRGRPKGSYRAIAPRDQNILPTAELLAKRAALLGNSSISDDPGSARSDQKNHRGPHDPRAGYPLGIMLARGLVEQEEHDAGLWYGWLHRRRYGAPLANAAPFYERMVAPSLRMSPTAPQSEEIESRLEQLYIFVDHRLMKDAGPLAKREIQDTVIFETLPGYITERQENWRPTHPFFDLKAGLKVIDGIRSQGPGSRSLRTSKTQLPEADVKRH